MASTDKNNSKSKKKADKELIANVIEVKEEDIPDNGSGFLFDFEDEAEHPETEPQESQTAVEEVAQEIPVIEEEMTKEEEKTGEVQSLKEDIKETEISSADGTEELKDFEAETSDPEVLEEIDKTLGEVSIVPTNDPTDIVEQALTNDDDGGDKLTVAYFSSRAYLEYAISVVKGRALPEVSDGQKPVQRRILYAMRRMGLIAEAKQVKSARIVGDVLGKFHPHGDVAAYDAMVRMAQDFTMRYPLVHGEGNFGSQDGDSPAHMRYTEAKLSKYSELLLEEIDEGGTKFVPNYDGAFKEPVTLPARLPFILLNGASGIAVGMATEIPPHNLVEVANAAEAVIKNPKITLDELMQFIPGPDFPGGAQIISSEKDIKSAYSTGYGSLLLRARYEFEELARGQWQLVVTELPYKVGAAKVLAELDSLTNPKAPAGKKTLSAKQQQDKALLLSILDTVRDESDTDNPVRIVFEPKSKAVDRNEFVNILFSKTSLECGCKFNLVAIGIDGKPRQKGLVEILSEWCTFRLGTVLKRSQTRLDDVQGRIHVLEGRMLIIVNIEEVIRLIREAKDPKAALMKTFGLTDAQAEDILELKLRQLANLDEIKLQKEIDQLKSEEAALLDVINNDSKLRALVCKEIRSDAKKYGDERRTLIEQAQTATLIKKVADEPVTVIISEKGFLRARTGHGCDAANLSFKLGDSLKASFECRTVDNLIVMAHSGRVYSVPVSQLPNGRGDGVHVSAFVQFQDKDAPFSYVCGDSDFKVLLASSDGYGFWCKLGDMVSRQKSGKTFFTLNDETVKPLPLRMFTDAQTLVSVLTQAGRFLDFEIDELRSLPNGGRGVALISLAEGDRLAAALPSSSKGVIACGLGRGNKEQTYPIGPRLIETFKMKRARKGKQLPNKWNYYDLLPSKFDEKLEVPGANEGEGGVSENTDTRADEKPTVSADSNSQTISGKEQKETGKTDADKQLDDFVLTSEEQGNTGLLF